VPLPFTPSRMVCSGLATLPRSKVMPCAVPSLCTSTSVHALSAFTHLTPTPCSPPETLYALLSNLPPAWTSVRITSTAGRPLILGLSDFIGSTGMPRPSSTTVHEPSTPSRISTWLAKPAIASSIELSTHS
jgi:hypothetical protein